VRRSSMQMIDKFCAELPAKLQSVPLFGTQQRGPYLVIVHLALEALKASRSRATLHVVARQVLGTLWPLRRVLAGQALRAFPDARDATYVCAVGLKVAGVEHPDLGPAIDQIDVELPEDLRREACNWANEECEGIRKEWMTEQRGWLVVDTQIAKGCRHENAHKIVMLDEGWAKFQASQALKAWSEHMRRSEVNPRETARVLPDFGSYLSAPGVVSIVFGDQTKVALVGGKLSVLFAK
jgi:hypothetical protein